MTTAAQAFKRKGLLRLSWPLLAVTVFTLLGTLGNTVLLSQASSSLNAAVATANQVFGGLYDISVLFSIGALVVIAQFLGAGRLAAAQRSSSIALRASAILGLAIAAFVLVAAPWLVELVNTPATIAPDAVLCMQIAAFGLAFNAYILGAMAVLRAYGRTLALFVLGVIVNILDIVLLYTLLFVFDLGVVAAALPTLLVRGVGVLILAAMVKRRTGAGLFGKLPPKGQEHGEARQMAWLSAPTVLEAAAYNLVIIAVVSWMNVLGEDAINARSYALTLTALVTGVILALAQGNETIVGWDAGERALGQAKRLTLRTAAYTAGAVTLFALLLWFFADAALSIFGLNDAVLEQARTALLISVLLLPLSAVTTIIYGALRSTGDVIVPMVYSIASSVLVLLPVSLLFVKHMNLGVAGVFWGLVFAEAVRSGLLLTRWIRGRWAQRPSLVDAPPAQFAPSAEMG